MSASKDSAGIFRLRILVWCILALAGGVIWFVATKGAHGLRAWRALLINFLFFTSLAGGLVVWPAVVRTCNGKWSERLERSAVAGISFSVASVLFLVLLWFGSSRWSPWYGTTFHQGAWLDNSLLFGRDLAALILFWGTALWYLISRRRSEAIRPGGILILVYALVFTLFGFDLVMALDPHWFSTLAGGYFFISGLYIAITGWAFLAVWEPEATREQLHDLGKLMVAFSIMTTYLMYSHLLPIWYENLPHEVRFVVPRMQLASWKVVSYLLLGMVYFGPLVLLLMQRAKENRWSLGGISLLVLVGMWLERWWLVAPTFESEVRLGLVELAAAAMCLGVFGIGLELFHWRVPQHYLRGEQ